MKMIYCDVCGEYQWSVVTYGVEPRESQFGQFNSTFWCDDCGKEIKPLFYKIIEEVKKRKEKPKVYLRKNEEKT